MDCQPLYSYTPDWVSGDFTATIPGFTENRSRLWAGGTFFRSKTQGTDRNNLSITITQNITTLDLTAIVRFYDNTHTTILVTETYSMGQSEPDINGVCLPSAIDDLRNQINTLSQYVEMVSRNYDIFDVGEDSGCLSEFDEVFLTGGNGAPNDASILPTIKTGPRYSLILIRSTEDSTGAATNPPNNKRIQQWNGASWIPYCNNIQGSCPSDICP